MIHPLSDVRSCNIGEGTTVWQYVVILENARIGEGCNINCHVFIENDVIIGDGVTVKSGVQLWDGLRIGDHVFIGPNVTFTNDLIPRSKLYPGIFLETHVEDWASIGANATILAGITIGRGALIGAGAVVTRDVPPYTVWYGNPAGMKGYISADNKILTPDLKDKEGNPYILCNGQPILVTP
jgi:UDP-2-acetamido-3-amino-2,3-dideoxy-glucuronate N-acetyltransferase